ncbi:MAG: hypothetical protein J5639_07385 [Bacteroidales bacterium]|nr:hypothetical protein [Bacteroidales bacterium]
MKKLYCLGLALLACISVCYAQEPVSHAKRAYLSVQGGYALNVYENAFSYRDNHRGIELLTPQGGLSIGYDFSDSFGLRLAGAFGKDAGACNVRETSGGGFYPYSFRHFNAFLDGVINLNGLAGKITYFRPKVYFGLGGAYTSHFTDAKHPWQKVVGKNIVPGFRLGFIAEYTFNSGFGVFVDICGEAYTDMYNGLMPSKEDQKRYEGYGGFPLDLRGIVTPGIIIHF